MREIFAALPLVSLDNIRRTGGLAAAFINLRVGALIAAVAALLAVLTGDAMQWGSLGIGAYAIATWAQRYYLSDRPLYSVTFGDSTFVLTVLAITLIGSIVGTVGFWTAPYAMRTFVDRSPVEIGTYLAVAYTSGAIGGVVLGGWITDRWKTKTRKAPAILPAIQILCFAPVLCAMMLVSDFPLFVLCYLATGLLTSVHSGGFHALVQDLVLPRMRGSASACQALISIIIIFGTGPYLAGKVSTVTGSLATGILSVLLLVPVTLYVLWTLAARLDAVTPEQRQAIAAAAGEPPVSPS